MDVLSAATETVANADAIEAAVAKAQKLPMTASKPDAAAAAAAAVAAAAATADTPPSSCTSSPRPSSPANSAATSKDGVAGEGASRTESSEMEVDDGAAPSRSRDGGAPPVPPSVLAAHAALVKNAEDIKTGTGGCVR